MERINMYYKKSEINASLLCNGAWIEYVFHYKYDADQTSVVYILHSL